MRQLSKPDASFLNADTIHANSNVTFVQIYDQSTVPGGTLRHKEILAHTQGRLHCSPTSCRALMPDPLVFTQCVRDSFQEFLALADAAPAVKRAAKKATTKKAAKKPGPAGPRVSASGRRRPSFPKA